MTRSFALFFHLIGTIALFAGFAVEWLTKTAVTESVLRRLYGIGTGAILLSGMFLAWVEHSFELAWVRVSFGLLLLMGILGARWRAGTLPLRAATGFVALFVMIAKLDLNGSLVVAGLGIGAGVVTAYLTAWYRPDGY